MLGVLRNPDFSRCGAAKSLVCEANQRMYCCSNPVCNLTRSCSSDRTLSKCACPFPDAMGWNNVPSRRSGFKHAYTFMLTMMLCAIGSIMSPPRAHIDPPGCSNGHIGGIYIPILLLQGVDIQLQILD